MAHTFWWFKDPEVTGKVKSFKNLTFSLIAKKSDTPNHNVPFHDFLHLNGQTVWSNSPLDKHIQSEQQVTTCFLYNITILHQFVFQLLHPLTPQADLHLIFHYGITSTAESKSTNLNSSWFLVNCPLSVPLEVYREQYGEYTCWWC